MSARAANQIRIIAGQWRGRRLSFPDVEGLRPTSDRLRETLFNWLAPVLPGARCLDLFAGSGALGFEAASRGASRVVMVDCDSQVVSGLQESRALLGATQVEVLRGRMQSALAQTEKSFDIVFLDPPFAQPGLLDAAVSLLVQTQRVTADGWVYVEQPRSRCIEGVPPHWRLFRHKQAGAVSYRLYRCASE